jgi:hypothetical protein
MLGLNELDPQWGPFGENRQGWTTIRWQRSYWGHPSDPCRIQQLSNTPKNEQSKQVFEAV